MYYINILVVGLMLPLLAYTVAGTWKAYASYRARNLSAIFRDLADEQLSKIHSDREATPAARKLAMHLRSIVSDTDEMMAKGSSVLSGADPENGDDLVAAFQQHFGPVWAKRFEDIFPIMTTASLLLHPELGRMYYRTIMRSNRVASVDDIAFKRPSPQESPKAPPVLLFRASARHEDATWGCLAA